MGKLAAVALVALVSFAHAEDAKTWLAAAKQLVQKGDAATRAKKSDEAKMHYDNAVTAYAKAIEAGASVNVYYDLAAFEEKVGRFADAVTHYRALVKADGARADLVKKAQSKLDALTTKIGLMMIITKPEGTTISIDGEEVAKTPLAEPLVLMPGSYTFVFAAEGHQPKELQFQVEPGSESERTIELEETKVIVQPVEPVEKPVEPAPIVVAPRAPSKLPLYIGVGAAGGFAIAATITGIMAVGKHGTFEDENASPADREDAKDSGKTLALVTDIAIAGAVVAGGFMAYWYFAKYRPAQRKLETERSAKATVVPWVKPDAGGLVLAGSF